MAVYTCIGGRIGQYQTEFEVESNVPGGDAAVTSTLNALMDDGEPHQAQVMIVIKTSGVDSLIQTEPNAAGLVGKPIFLTSGENTMDVDVLITRLQDCAREAGYVFGVYT